MLIDQFCPNLVIFLSLFLHIHAEHQNQSDIEMQKGLRNYGISITTDSLNPYKTLSLQSQKNSNTLYMILYNNYLCI